MTAGEPGRLVGGHIAVPDRRPPTNGSALRAATGGDLGATAALAGTSNVLPIAVLCLGAAVFARGWAPRATGALPVGGFLLQTIGQGIGAPPRSSTCHRSPTSHQSPG